MALAVHASQQNYLVRIMVWIQIMSPRSRSLSEDFHKRCVKPLMTILNKFAIFGCSANLMSMMKCSYYKYFYLSLTQKATQSLVSLQSNEHIQHDALSLI